MSLTKAFQPHNLADFADVTVTPDIFSVKICEMNTESQQFMVRVADFAKECNREHPIFSTDDETRNAFYADWNANKVTSDTLALLVNVVIVDWSLLDDDGNDVPFDTQLASGEFTKTPRVATKLIRASMLPAFFEQDALKN